MRQRLSLNLLLSGGCQYTRPGPLTGEVMSVQAISWVIEKSKHKGNSFVVLLMIANHARSDGTGAWPSIKTLARESRISERTVQRTIKRLIRFQNGRDSELICDVGRGPNGCNMYSIPGVKVSPWGRQSGTSPVSDIVTSPVSALSPDPSFIRPNTTVNPRKLELRKLREERERQDLLRRYSDRRVSR